LDVAIANGGIVDTTSQGVWFPMEVLELGKNALCKGHEREYALCAGIVLQTGRTGSEVEDMVENHAEDIAALPDPLRTMLQKMIIDRMTGCEQQGGGYSPPAARPSKPTPERWVHHEVTMKRTIKQWCKEHNVGWLGQGTTGSISYDWKLVLGKGRTAIFSSTVKGPLPEQKPVGSREVLIFPNVNSSKNGGKISEFAFLRLIAWVEDCLTGNIRGIQAPNKVPAPSWVCQQIRKRLIRT
jgi:hypothetical protein